jgi:glutamate-1-semialdehyde 2,1-aminomutase
MGRYDRSGELLKRAEAVIPLGSQTFSKSRELFPPGISPQFAVRGLRGRIWDADDNEYVDLVGGLASVSLGYADPEINAAVTDQLSRGVTLSLANELEAEVAERIVELVPCAEMVRFGKNGSDATSAAIRLARSVTGRDHVIVCGYHGWHDWYIGTTPRGTGVPEAVSSLAHPIPYGDLEALTAALAARPIAAVIMEPMTGVFPPEGYLDAVKRLAHEHGALLIFDETVTGFRFAKGGAQEYFGVTPDLSSFGKGMANGFPLSAVTGRADLMIEFERVFFSGTFGGELLSLTAARTILDRIMREPVVERIAANGQEMSDLTEAAIASTGMTSVLHLSGHPSWRFLNWNPELGDQLGLTKVLFMQEMCRRGVLVIATHNSMASHNSDDSAVVARAYEGALDVVRRALDDGDISSFLDAPVLTQATTVRQ